MGKVDVIGACKQRENIIELKRRFYYKRIIVTPTPFYHSIRRKT